MTTALQVARYIESSKPLYGTMHLQKILYYAQAWALAWTGKTLFVDEIEAWEKGPVVRSVYAWARYGGVAPSEDIPREAAAIVDAVYQFYGSNGGAALSERTHREAPWLEARGDLPVDSPSTEPISQATMRRYFTRISLSGEDQPIQPVFVSHSKDADVAIVASMQRARWRGALDELALT